ncbi:hypothetical protein HDV04_001656 [Boothiomyces sp. JEL0838]|nr:hypothetical protein HDV04_001656 [Boothiomyces sp. JEL0838]
MQDLPNYFEYEPEIRPAIMTLVNSQPLDNTPFIAPYVQINESVCRKALEFSGIKPTESLLDLGCGDGTILKTAYNESIQRLVGVEFDPLLCKHIRQNYPYIELYEQDMFTVDLELLNVDVMILYLLEQGLGKLKEILKRWLKNERRIVTVGYFIPGWVPVKTTSVKVEDGFMGGAQQDEQMLYYYDYTINKEQ